MSTKTKWSILAALIVVAIASAFIFVGSSPRASQAFCQTMSQTLGPDANSLRTAATATNATSSLTPSQQQAVARLQGDLRQSLGEGPPTSVQRWLYDYQIRLRLATDGGQLINALDRFHSFSAAPLRSACPTLRLTN